MKKAIRLKNLIIVVYAKKISRDTKKMRKVFLNTFYLMSKQVKCQSFPSLEFVFFQRCPCIRSLEKFR